MLFIVIKFAGIGYLLWLAWRMWGAEAAVAGDPMPSARRPWRMFLAGMAITLGNPKIMVFYLAVVPTLLDLAHPTFAAWAELTLTMLVVLMAIDLGWALAAARAAAAQQFARRSCGEPRQRRRDGRRRRGHRGGVTR
jgi:threonine/homoserine/homoserine lactone efflux protein